MSEPSPALRPLLSQILSLPLDYPERERLRKVLPADHFRAAVCILFQGTTFDDAKLLLTERSQSVLTHRGQVAFPGGGFDPEDGEDPIRAALRECEEEVGIPAEQIQALGMLPSFPTMTGNFEVNPVVAILGSPFFDPVLKLQESEVASAEWVSFQMLRASRVYEDHEVKGVKVRAPVFLWGERKMWGLSAWIFDLLLQRYDTLSV